MSDTFNMVVGDWSNDGHGRTDTYMVTTALTFGDVQQAFADLDKTMQSKYGFSFENVCEEYEDSTLTNKQLAALIDMGISAAEICDFLDEDSPLDPDKNYQLDSDSYVALLMKALMLQNPLLGLTSDNGTREKELHVGGYGLFYG